MQQHLLVTFVDWTKLIFCDGRKEGPRKDRQTDCRNSDVNWKMVIRTENWNTYTSTLFQNAGHNNKAI